VEPRQPTGGYDVAAITFRTAPVTPSRPAPGDAVFAALVVEIPEHATKLALDASPSA
jgi:hypothetical protein